MKYKVCFGKIMIEHMPFLKMLTDVKRRYCSLGWEIRGERWTGLENAPRAKTSLNWLRTRVWKCAYRRVMDTGEYAGEGNCTIVDDKGTGNALRDGWWTEGREMH
jgi:hypothetical protein